MSQLSALELIELLKDRLNEAADCMSADLENIKRNGLTTTDVERMIGDSRYFVDLANSFIKEQEKPVVGGAEVAA